MLPKCIGFRLHSTQPTTVCGHNENCWPKSKCVDMHGGNTYNLRYNKSYQELCTYCYPKDCHYRSTSLSQKIWPVGRKEGKVKDKNPWAVKKPKKNQTCLNSRAYSNDLIEVLSLRDVKLWKTTHSNLFRQNSKARWSHRRITGILRPWNFTARSAAGQCRWGNSCFWYYLRAINMSTDASSAAPR